MDLENKIKEVLEKIRPYLVNDGGDIEFIKFENGVVYVKLIGACSNCPMATNTLEEGVKVALMGEIPEVTKVINVD